MHNWTRLKGPPFNFFWHCEIFFENFINVSNESPISFFKYLFNKLDVKKPKSSPFYSFGTISQFLNSLFWAYIRFSQNISSNNFFYTIRIFDAIAEIFCIFTKEEQEEAGDRKQANIRPSTKRLAVSTRLCEFFDKKVLSIFKNFALSEPWAGR